MSISLVFLLFAFGFPVKIVNCVDEKQFNVSLLNSIENVPNDGISPMQLFFREWQAKLEGHLYPAKLKEFVESLLEMECLILQNWQNQANFDANLIQRVNEICNAANKIEIIEKNDGIIPMVSEFFKKDGPKIMEKLRRMESNVERDLVAKFGQLTIKDRSKRGVAILQLSAEEEQLCMLEAGSNFLRLIESKMKWGPAKKVMGRLLGEGAILKPSQLMELVIELWEVVSQRDVVVQQNPTKSTELQRKSHDSDGPTWSEYGKDVPKVPIQKVAVHRRRRRSFDQQWVNEGLLIGMSFSGALAIIFVGLLLSDLIGAALRWPWTLIFLSVGLYIYLKNNSPFKQKRPPLITPGHQGTSCYRY